MSLAQRYATTQNETASKERLMVLLFEAALRHIRTAAASLEGGRFDQASTPLSKALAIVTELLATLDPKHAPELVATLSELYKFVNGRLLGALATRDAKAVREAERVFLPIVEGFQGAVAQLQAQAARR